MNEDLGLIGVDFDKSEASLILIVPFDEFADLYFGGQGITSTVM